ncbi:hypothetical protein HQ576_01075 [bacterium]|nr:hypothetical protein [bacterium]
MAVLVAKTPQRRYQTVGTVAVSQSDFEQADRLDKRLERRIATLVRYLRRKMLMPSGKSKGGLLAYWELGKALRDVVGSDDFPSKAELPLLWINAKMHLPEELTYADRGPHREHLWYCFRLGGYSRVLAKKMKWGEWVTIFDSRGINAEPRFDQWFAHKLSQGKASVERKQIRVFAPCVNAMLGSIDVHDLTDEELFNCYEAAWEISAQWSETVETHADHAGDTGSVKHSIGANMGSLDDVMEGQLSPSQYAALILRTTTGQ